MSKSASAVIRYKPSRRRKPFSDENYHTGINDEAIDKMVGGILTLWPHIEDQMIPLFAELIGTTNDKSARLILSTTTLASKSCERCCSEHRNIKRCHQPSTL